MLQWLLWLLRQASGLTDSLSALETVGPNPRRKHPPLALKGAHFMITGVNALTAHGYFSPPLHCSSAQCPVLERTW